MNNLQSYSPLVRPLYFDSLVSREGCEVISGNNVLGWLAYVQACIFAHDSGNPRFTQPDTVSYALGPVDSGHTSHPFVTSWAAWVGASGVRVGSGLVLGMPLTETTGVASALYPTTRPDKLSMAFSESGLLALAIQKTSGTIELKRYTDFSGTVATKTWLGTSCLLFDTAFLDSSLPTRSGIMALYLRPEIPAALFGRFESEPAGAFTVEHTLMPALRATPSRLIAVEAVGRRQVLRFIDVDGRDGTLTSPVYTASIEIENKVPVTISLLSGLVNKSGVPKVLDFEKATISLSLEDSIVYNALVGPSDPLPTEQIGVSLELDSGEVIR